MKCIAEVVSCKSQEAQSQDSYMRGCRLVVFVWLVEMLSQANARSSTTLRGVIILFVPFKTTFCNIVDFTGAFQCSAYKFSMLATPIGCLKG